ncbi:MAG: HEPN domain-containing protein [Ignavibacteriales bacterium]|nr:HEPN domain-containing protein [Ignavibacteriales bacterium]
MHADTNAWILKAEGDYLGASTLAKKRNKKIAHLTCFAAQQCAEKYLKAFLVENNITFPKTHDLTKDLLPRCLKIDREFSMLLPHLEYLDPYAVQFRYPGDIVTSEEALQSIKAMKIIRKFVRQKLDLEKQRRLL